VRVVVAAAAGELALAEVADRVYEGLPLVGP
jgi:hypothetical protein